MRHFIIIPLIAFSSIALAVLVNQSESSGLFGAIIAVGCYCASLKGAPC